MFYQVVHSFKCGITSDVSLCCIYKVSPLLSYFYNIKYMRDYFVIRKMFYSLSNFHPLVQHPLMLVWDINYGGCQMVIFSHHHSLPITWHGHIKTSVTLFPFTYLLISEWMNMCLFYLIGYNSLSLLFNLMSSLFKWEVLLFGFCALFTCPHFSYSHSFWHVKLYQDHLELWFPQTWNQPSLLGHLVPFTGEFFIDKVLGTDWDYCCGMSLLLSGQT